MNTHNSYTCWRTRVFQWREPWTAKQFDVAFVFISYKSIPGPPRGGLWTPLNLQGAINGHPFRGAGSIRFLAVSFVLVKGFGNLDLF